MSDAPNWLLICCICCGIGIIQGAVSPVLIVKETSICSEEGKTACTVGGYLLNSILGIVCLILSYYAYTTGKLPS